MKDGELADILSGAYMNILTPVAIAEMLHMSERWVYLHAAELGASRIGGSWIFTQEGLIDALQRARRLESIRQDRRGKKASVVSIKEGSLGVGRKNKKRPKDAEIEDRHGITAAFNGVS